MTSNTYVIFEVPKGSPENTESMGTKEKFWFTHPKLGKCLFKTARPNTGENWAEKVASELCDLISLPHATYELAKWDGKHGVFTPSLHKTTEKMIHGNEILISFNQKYPGHPDSPKYRISQHTISLVLKAITQNNPAFPPEWIPLEGINSAVELFLGYLLLDAWVGNTDRHHENWAFIETEELGINQGFSRYLSPTYDHASSLGRNLSDKEREKRLKTKDKGYTVEAYIQNAKARSALYAKEEDKTPLTMIDAFSVVAKEHPQAAKSWLESLKNIEERKIEDLFGRFPKNIVSPWSFQFAQEMLRLNRERLLKLTY